MRLPGGRLARFGKKSLEPRVAVEGFEGSGVPLLLHVPTH